ncbi:phage terminase large subunit family protein [Treponema primitia]
MQNFSPYSPIQTVAIIKPRKVGLTTIMENVVAYWMSEMPTKILYSTATEELAKEWSTTKIEEVIDTLGFRNKITSNSYNPKSHRSGSNLRYKEFAGGRLDIASSQSMDAKRQKDIRVLMVDEVDGLDKQLTTGEGSWIEVLKGHTLSWGNRKKIAFFSSPTTDENSQIKELYEAGDRRVFIVPCPICGKPLELKMSIDPMPYGLHADTKAGEILTAYYLCEHCGEPIFDHQKKDFYSSDPHCLRFPQKKLDPCHWEPTVKSTDEYYRSYSLNALYSPLGMVSFTDVYKEHIKAEAGGPDAMRSYVNLYAGQPYKDQGTRPKLAKVLEHRGTYPAGDVPPGVLFLTMACDIQRGSAKERGNGSRIELSVMGTGLGYRSWIICYKVFEGPTDDAYSGAFEDMYEWMKSIDGTFYSREGIRFRISMIGIDSGDAADGRADVVYRFAERWNPFCYPIKGFAQLTARRGEKADIPGAASFKKYRLARIGTAGEYVIEISTAYYKNLLFSRLNIPPADGPQQKPGYCDFPSDMADDFFVQLTNSEKRADGSFRDIGAHEVMDTVIYNYCLADAWLDAQVRIAKEQRRAAGVDPTLIELTTNSKTVLSLLETQLLAYGASQDPR